MYHIPCEHFCQQVKSGAGGCQKRRQVSVEHLLRQKKTAVSICHHCSLPIKRPVKHFEGDGLRKRAGDGTRTRDSLLGRQVVILSPLVWFTSALQPVSYDVHAM